MEHSGKVIYCPTVSTLTIWLSVLCSLTGRPQSNPIRQKTKQVSLLSPDPKNYVVCEVEHPSIVHKTVFPKSSKFRWGCQKTRSENTQYSLKSHFQPRKWTFPAKQGDQPAFGMKYAYINAITTERPHMQTGGRQAMTQGSCRQLTQGHFLLEDGAWERREDMQIPPP